MLVVTGCGKHVAVGGKVVFSDDGSPVPCGRVCFSTDDFQAFGDIKEDGTYVVGTLSTKDGLPPGSYKISITGALRATETLESGDVLTEPLVDAKYSGPSTSGLTANVSKGTTKFDFQLDRYGKKK